jgi:excisionase family DNA binding protein
MSTSSQEENVVASVKSLADLEKIERDAISVSEAAKIIGVSTRRVYMFVSEGRLGMRMFGRYVITRAQALAFKKIPRIEGRRASPDRQVRRPGRR